MLHLHLYLRHKLCYQEIPERYQQWTFCSYIQLHSHTQNMLVAAFESTVRNLVLHLIILLFCWCHKNLKSSFSQLWNYNLFHINHKNQLLLILSWVHQIRLLWNLQMLMYLLSLSSSSSLFQSQTSNYQINSCLV